MYECHQVQNHISQQLSHLMNQQSMDPTTNYHRQAASQLKTEVTAWYNSFHRLVKSQGEYVRALCRWIKLTYCFVEDSQRSVSASAVHTLCEEWQLALDRLPDKVFMLICSGVVALVCDFFSSPYLCFLILDVRFELDHLTREYPFRLWKLFCNFSI